MHGLAPRRRPAEGQRRRLGPRTARSTRSGEEALSPAVDQRGFAAFLYEELTWPHVTFQFGGRVDHTNYEPVGETARDFTSGSGSLGLLLRPAAADDASTIALSLARAARNPALEELFFFGPHPGNFAFEVGNPDLGPEHALGFDAVAAVARDARLRRGHLLPQRHQRLHLPEPDQPRRSSSSASPEFEDALPGARASRGPGRRRVADRRVRRAPTACCRASKRTPTSA